ncbi:MAG: molybdopterin-dependent oxidoreductase [Chloroflexi bacterium]|nr:molybdopterin-dependent oxidoreductase [Chloroflexota bacterium]
MRYPWANTILLFLVMFELVTGLLGLVAGSPDRAFLLNLHLMGAFGILSVLGWKTLIVLRSLRRPRPSELRAASLLVVALLLSSIAFGITWTWTGFFAVGGITGMSLHIYAGLAAAPLVVWHAVKYTRGFRFGHAADRRTALRLFGFAVAGAAAWWISESIMRRFALPGGSRRFTGSFERGSFGGNAFPSTSWINDNPAPIDRESWRLRVDGEVEEPAELSYALMTSHASGALNPEAVTATLDCTGGWYSTQQWSGIPVSRVLALVRPKRSAKSVTFTSLTGYYRRASLDEAEGYLLATRVGGEELAHWHGAPVRLVAPGRRGYEWVKWVTRITVNDTSKWRQPPLPLQ